MKRSRVQIEEYPTVSNSHMLWPKLSKKIKATMEIMQSQDEMHSTLQ